MNEWVAQTNIKGPTGERGSRWYQGPDYPLIAMPDDENRVEGDMYLKEAEPDAGSVWRWSAAQRAWVFSGNDITGPPGPANDLEIGTVTTGPSGSEADAEITGTPPNQTLNLTIPRGDPGPSGGGASVTTAPPATPVMGQLWWHPTEKTLRVWDGSMWEPVLATWG